MKKIIGIIIIVVLLILGGILYFSKTSEKDNAKITILETVWWENDDEQKMEKEEISKDYDVKKGDTINININYWDDDLTLEIISIKDNYIEVKSSEELSDTGGVLEGKTKFKIEKGKKTTLNTLTLDAGAIYEIEIK